ncbi:MAG: hypothetical protein ACOX5W_01140 [Bacillota bacterium]
MKIDSSIISMTSQQSVYQEYNKRETLRVWTAPGQPNLAKQGSSLQPVAANYTLELSPEALEALQQNSEEIEIDIEAELPEKDKQRIMVLQKMLSLLTGKEFKFVLPKKIRINPNSATLKLGVRQISGNGPQRLGWGLEYTRYESYRESERLSFNASGIIKTADGREIVFTTELNMSRQFVQENNIAIRAGDAPLTDPLIINYKGAAAELTTTKFSFDLDTDGLMDQISFVKGGSGFLALDRNGDGVINNGSELFGPKTGNGFAELGQYDVDGNGWIDESDPIYQQLCIWTKDAEGKDCLLALGQVGVGAIYLGHLAAGFSYKDEDNQLLGVARKAGIFVRENGTVGTVQQVDLAI